MIKMDGMASRTPADLERKYNFGRNFSEVLGIALDAQTHAEEAAKTVQEWSQRVEGDFSDIYAELSMRVEKDSDGNLVGSLNIGANQLTIDTDNFFLDLDGNVEIKGKVTADDGFIGKWNISKNGIVKNNGSTYIEVNAPESEDESFIKIATLVDDEVTDIPFTIMANGDIDTRGKIYSHNEDHTSTTTITNGRIETNSGSVGGWEINETFLSGTTSDGSCTVSIRKPSLSTSYVIRITKPGGVAPFFLQANGNMSTMGQIRSHNSDYSLETIIDRGLVSIEGDWGEFEENMSFLLLRFVGPDGEYCGVMANGNWVYDAASQTSVFKYTGLSIKQLGETGA